MNRSCGAAAQWAAILLLVVLQSCATPGVSHKPETMGPPEPQTTETRSPEVETQGPPAPQSTKSVSLIIGPGMARTLESVGVLQTLESKNIRVSELVGFEMGATIAALYSTNARTGALEWNLMKLNLPDVFSKQSWVEALLSESPSRQTFKKNMKKVLGGRTFESLKIPTAVLVKSAHGYEWLQSGALDDAIDRAIFEGDSAEAHIPVAEVLARVPAPRIWVGSLAAGETIPAGDTHIDPASHGIDRMNFKLQNEIIFQGRKAANQAFSEETKP